jgi:hypothetical protein
MLKGAICLPKKNEQNRCEFRTHATEVIKTHCAKDQIVSSVIEEAAYISAIAVRGL